MSIVTAKEPKNPSPVITHESNDNTSALVATGTRRAFHVEATLDEDYLDAEWLICSIEFGDHYPAGYTVVAVIQPRNAVSFEAQIFANVQDNTGLQFASNSQTLEGDDVLSFDVITYAFKVV